MEETIALTKEAYEELLKDQRKLIALESAGVDNWQGYGDAMEILEEMENENDTNY